MQVANKHQKEIKKQESEKPWAHYEQTNKMDPTPDRKGTMKAKFVI